MTAPAALLDRVLDHAAGMLGDLVPSLFERYYRRFPEARDAFSRLALGDVARLEAAMADACLYCVLHWLERPLEVRLILADQVPHHGEVLGLDPRWVGGLVDETLAVIRDTLAPNDVAGRALCETLARELGAEVAAAGAVRRTRRR